MSKHVVVLHGLALNRLWMSPLAFYLKRAGYVVHNISYPSTRLTIQDIAQQRLIPFLKSLPTDMAELNFVTHSMGGIVLRACFKDFSPPVSGRTVMIGPPNHGSEAADILKNLSLFKWYFGPAGQELVTDPEHSTPKKLGPVNFETGVIAGSRGFFHLYFGQKLPKPNDGLVTEASTKVKGLTDHITLNTDHSMMVFSPQVMRQTVHFLQNGLFNR